MKQMIFGLTWLAIAPLAHAETFKLIHTADLAPLLGRGGHAVYVFDANNDQTREKEGVIPGATLLASHNDYSLNILPKGRDSKLVFYCANERCMASHAAAKRAAGAGYTDVNVLSDGIMGWKKHGQKTAPFKPGRS